MASVPQECLLDYVVKMPGRRATRDDERVVISGMSGSYPKAHNVKELSENLYNKVNPITHKELRWNYDHPDVPQYAGLIPELDKFDVEFFKVKNRLGVTMDPMSRKILEHTYQAIFDAGVNPGYLSGKKVGVYIGSCLSETEKASYCTSVPGESMGVAGCSQAMFANRVTYWLDLKGPSCATRAACCSSVVALEQAYQAMMRGVCEAAIVGGCNLCLHPQTSIHVGRHIQLCKDGKTKSYDQTANGCVLSEAVNVLFLQKAKDALRIYANVVHVKTEYVSLKSNGSFKRETEEMTQFLKGFYDEVTISPKDVEYIEGFGVADIEVDKCELQAIDNVFCPGRKEPLHIGSVMSNLGFTQAASGIAGITKVLLGYHSGLLAGNLHYTNPRDDIEAIREGRIKILSDHKPVARSFVAVNGLSMTGLNSHVLLKGHYKPKDLLKYLCNIPRLVLISGKTDAAVQTVINDLKTQAIDAEQLALIQNIHSFKINGHLGRGFTILDTNKELKTISLCEKAEYFDGGDRPLWFVYSGMGSQWPGMGAQLMRLPIFAAAIKRCQKALEPKSVDIMHIITSPDKTIFDNILHSFVGISAMQIGLTDVLLEMGLIPNKIIGHSLGELACAYADGCMTAEEAILMAYSRGLVSIQTSFIRGSMAAVGIGFDEVSKMCPPEIEVGCHNASNSCTISGPAEIMAKFIAQLTAKGIFAKEVPCSNIAYHSRYISEAGPAFLRSAKEVIKTHTLRSERWLLLYMFAYVGHESLFDGKLGRFTGEPVRLSVREGAEPIFCRARPLPYALRARVDAELDEMLRAGVIEPVDRADWATPLVIARKADGGIRICADYKNPVLFEEASRLIPDNAVLVEVAPHGLLQAILRRSLPSCVHVPLTRRGHADNARFMLEAIGKLFMEGFYPDIRVLYPKVEFPVSTATPHLSHLVGWAHQEKWFFARYQNPERRPTATCTFKISLHDAEYKYLQGNQINGKTLFPFASALVSAWDTLAMSQHMPRRKFPVLFRDVQLFAQPILHDSRLLRLHVSIHRVSGLFEIIDDITKVATGYIESKQTDGKHNVIEEEESTEGIILNTEDIYQLLNERGYMYREEFRSISKSNASFTDALVSWTGNWAVRLDAVLQLHALREPHEGISQPEFIRHIEIDTDLHENGREPRKVNVCTVRDVTSCGGITMKGVHFRNIVKPDESSFVLSTKKLSATHQDRIKHISTIVKVLQSSRVGDLESLHWVEASAPQVVGISVKVHFVGLNASDVLKVTGEIPFEDQHYASDSYYGMDFSGTTATNQRVMGVVRGGAASSCVRADPTLLWPVPAHWSLEDAATVPMPYAHALYCLAIKTRLLPRSRILVSGGAGATGQAIISLALHVDCRVFVVVRDILKKRFLMKMFPKLNADDIICCRDDTFADRVMIATKGKGCEYVICGKGDTKDAYLRCSACCGYTLDIHQIGENEDFSFKMNALSGERTYIRIDFGSIFQNNEILNKLQSLVAEGISTGAVRPLTRVCYAPYDAARAFRLLAASQHRGRVLLRMPDTFSPSTEPRIVCSTDRCQLIISDDEGLAVHLANRLVKRGARILHLQIADTTARFRLAEELWRKLNVNVVKSSEKSVDKNFVSILLQRSLRLGPVDGVFLIVSKLLDDQTQEIYESFIANLDAEIQMQCPDIKFFAVTGINNSVGEKICVSRAVKHLPAMMLSVTMQTKIEDTTSNLLSSIYSDIVNAIEKGLMTIQPIIVAQHSSARQGSLSRQIASIAGVKISKSTSISQTLRDLGITLDKPLFVSLFLRDKLNVAMSKKEVPLLTVKRIREIETTLTESDYAPTQGLNAFFFYVCSDELLASMDTVMLPTLTVSSGMRDDEFYSGTCLYIMPGMQGLHEPYQRMCERLQLATVVVQPGLDYPNECIQETTARYAKILLNKITGTNKFYLLGHEWGVIIALDLAAILEDHGLTGTVFCLGGGPDEFVDELERQLQTECAGDADSAQTLQEAVARHMCALMGVASAQLDAAIRDASSWQEKVETSVRALRGRVAFSTQYARLLLESAYARVTQARLYGQLRAYVTPRALRSRVVLLRSPPYPAQTSHPLQRYSQLPLAVHDLRAPLASAAYDLRVAAIVNQYLDDESKESFAEKYLCHTYLMNAESYIHRPGATGNQR